MKLFEVKLTFFALLQGHILAIEMLASLIIYVLGPGWCPAPSQPLSWPFPRPKAGVCSKT